MKQRVKWIDTARCFGIFAVYLGHFGEHAGRMYPFLYTHHVPLFFFLSGCLAPREELSLADQGKKTLSGLLLPWFVFAVASAVFDTIYMDSGMSGFLALLKQIARGTIVNQYVAGGLWFLICLAGVRLLFHILRKLRHPAVIVLVCLGLFLAEQAYPIPKFYNLHRMLRFSVYYAAGFYLYPRLSGALSPITRRGRLLLTVSTLFSAGFAALVYFGRNPLAFLTGIPLAGDLIPVMQALAIIWLYLAGAKLLENVELFNQIGRNTLYLCGCEYFIRQLLKSAVRLFGLELAYPRPICAWICAALSLYLAHRWLTPAAKQLLNSLRSFPSWLLHEQHPGQPV